jgi:hypothetical protein
MPVQLGLAQPRNRLARKAAGAGWNNLLPRQYLRNQNLLELCCSMTMKGRHKEIPSPRIEQHHYGAIGAVATKRSRLHRTALQNRDTPRQGEPLSKAVPNPKPGERAWTATEDNC